MTTRTENLWETELPNAGSADAAVQRLSRMVAGNDNLAAEPGLTLALFQGNATPEQAQAIDKFMGGLNAENLVRTAATAGHKIVLTDDQKSSLDAMGIDYSHVEYTQQDAVTALKTKMAAQGYQPVLDSTGNVKTDAAGNVVAEKIPQPKKHSDGWFDSVGGFFHHLGNNPVTHFTSNALLRGNFSTNDDINSITGHDAGVGGVVTAVNEGYQYLSSEFSSNYQTATNPLAGIHADEQDADLAKRLGYDPSSFFSMQAFRAKGYAHSDTSAAANAWDSENPDKLFGWDGSTAVTEAEAFAANPEKYRTDIVADPTLTPEQIAAKIQAISSPQFQHLVARVNGDKSDVGADFARGIGIDPVKHPTAFSYTSLGIDLAASFVADPLAFGLKATRAAQVASTSLNGLSDAAGIERILRPVAGPSTMAQANVIAHVKDLVGTAKAIREAHAAGDTVAAAKLNARVQASNPFAPLLPDFIGEDQIVGHVGSAEALALQKGELPFVTGRGEAIDTFDKAVDYLSSKAALLRLQGGYSALETSVMPGALSSWGYSRLKGGLASWNAGRSAAESEASAEKFVSSAAADPGRLETLIKEGLLTRVIPAEGDAVDVLSGKVLAAAQRVAASEGLAEKWGAEAAHAGDRETSQVAAAAKAQLAADKTQLASAQRAYQAAQAAPAADDVAITDAGRGVLRGNKLRYGLSEAPSSALGKGLAIYTLGTLQRAKLALSRFANWLPRDTPIDLTSAQSADTIRKIARTYLTSGDANLMASRWVGSDLETRKTIVQGLREQLIHAAGLTRTKAGQELVAKWRAGDEKYATFGREFVDANGRNAAQFPGQVQTKFSLPNFGEVHKAAAKIGLYEGTMGRLLGSTPMEKLLTQWKLGALATPVTAMRANIESWLNAYAEGMFGDGVKAKALLRENGALDGEDIARSRPVDKILSFAPLQGAGRVYRHVVGSRMPAAQAQAIMDMPDDLLHAYIHDQSAYHYAMSVDPAGVGEATQIAQNGFHAVKASYDSKEGFEAALKIRKGFEMTDDVDGVAGANLYAHNLAVRVNKAPGVAHAILDRLENLDLYGPEHVVQALESGPAKRLMDQSLFGKVFLRPDGTQARAVTEAEVLLGKQQWADQITGDLKQLLTGRNGNLQSNVVAQIRRTGVAPDADWILNNVKGMNRPAALLKPTFDAVPSVDGLPFLIQELQRVEGKGYQWLVERLIQRHTTTPLFAAAYGKSKVLLEPFKQTLIEGGLSAEAAERATANVAAEQAWSRIAKMVDDPRLKSQMDVAGRAFFAFSRATTLMLRRWGGTFYRNPVQARRFQLAAEAAVHSGVVYKNENGDWTFHFPASGVAQEVLFHAMSHIPGLSSLAQFPTSDFTGRVTSIIPGSSNPFQYNTTPMVSIAGRELASLFPDHRELFDEVDAKLNGSQGQGQGIVATLEPSLFKKFWDPTANDRNSITTSAMVGSLYNLYAAGMVPKDGASPSELDTFFGRLRTQTKTQLFLRGLVGAFSPASINLPENGNEASKADYAYAASGLQNLRAEYKTLLNETGGDFARATAIWTALHPDLAVYTASGSAATVSGASMPSTQGVYNWLVKNQDFVDKYRTVSAFFIPQAAANEPFSMQAYRAQLEEGLRQKKTPEEFLTGVRVASAAQIYYAMETQYQSDLAEAKASGDTTTAAARRADWAAWSKQFKALHPSFTAKTEMSASNIVIADKQIADLKSMVAAHEVPGDAIHQQAVAGMVKAYDDYIAYRNSQPGSTNQATANRSAALQQLQDYLGQVVAVAPGLTDLYNAVFRPLTGYGLDQIANG